MDDGTKGWEGRSGQDTPTAGGQDPRGELEARHDGGERLKTLAYGGGQLVGLAEPDHHKRTGQHSASTRPPVLGRVLYIGQNETLTCLTISEHIKIHVTIG